MSIAVTDHLYVVVTLPDGRVVLQRNFRNKWECTLCKPLAAKETEEVSRKLVASIIYTMFYVRLSEESHSFKKVIDFCPDTSTMIAVYRLHFDEGVKLVIPSTKEIIPATFSDLLDKYTKNEEIFTPMASEVVTMLDLFNGGL